MATKKATKSSLTKSSKSKTMTKKALKANKENAKKGGRPKGSITEHNKMLLETKRKYQERAAKNVDILFNSQMSLAQGVAHLFRIDEICSGKGKNRKCRKETVLVDDPEEIRAYLDGEYEDDDSYYYITTKTPDSRTISDMLDRTIQKPKQEVELGEETTGGILAKLYEAAQSQPSEVSASPLTYFEEAGYVICLNAINGMHGKGKDKKEALKDYQKSPEPYLGYDE